MPRLFTAIILPEAARAALAALKAPIAGARWTTQDHLHLTLNFIGDVDDARAAAAQDALQTVRSPAFDLALAGAGSFRGRDGAILWAGCHGGPALPALHGVLRQALRAAGCRLEERAYAPHITLARVKGKAGPDAERWVKQHGTLALPAFRVSEFALLESRPRGPGSRYQTRATFALQDGR